MNDPEVLRMLTRSREMLQDHWTIGHLLANEPGYWGAGEFLPSAVATERYPTMCSVGALRVSELAMTTEHDLFDITDLFLSSQDTILAVNDDGTFRDYTSADTPYRRALICLVASMERTFFCGDEGCECFGASIARALRSGDWEDIGTATIEDIVVNWNDGFDATADSLAEVLELFDKAIGLVTPEPLSEVLVPVRPSRELVGV